MKVILAKSAGFCYGVRRAVEMAQQTAEETSGCWMLGDLIHNAHVVEDAQAVSVQMTDDRIFQASLVGSDEISDLAVMYEDAQDLVPAQFGEY